MPLGSDAPDAAVLQQEPKRKKQRRKKKKQAGTCQTAASLSLEKRGDGGGVRRVA